jgi:hypothetical protein
MESPWRTSIFHVEECVEKVNTFPQARPEECAPDIFHKNIPTLNTVMLEQGNLAEIFPFIDRKEIPQLRELMLLVMSRTVPATSGLAFSRSSTFRIELRTVE